MSGLRAWLRPPRKLLILFGVVLFLPAASLITLGVRLLDQDRALARQRQGDRLEHAADQAVRALEQDLAALRKPLAGYACSPADVPEDTVCVVLHANRFQAVPPRRIPYYPRTPGLEESPTAPFRELEAQEFGEAPNFARALEIGRKLAASHDAPIRAGALLREARVFRAVARPNDALAAYDELSRIASVSINGEPADLVARRARCAVLEEQSRTPELRREVETLAADLRGGRWQLDRETYLYAAGLVSRWQGSEVRPSEEEEALAAGVAWLHNKWSIEAPAEQAAAGAQVLRWNRALVTIVWQVDKSRAAAVIAGPGFLEKHWLAQLQKASSPAQAYLEGVGAAPPPDAQRVQRRVADTGLPWTVMVATTSRQREPAEFPARRRNLFAGMAAVLVLVAAGSYFLWRSVNRDLAVARLQSDFVSAVSHEFRTPLTALRQFNDLLSEEDGPTPEKRRRYYEAQTRATERLHYLVESLLDFARMEAGRRPYRFDRLDVGNLARDVTEEYRLEGAGAGFALTCSVDSARCPVTADREALSRALRNLLDNAVKYSGSSRAIQVEVRRTDGVVSIGVRDHGSGIPSVEQKQIFQKFVRGTAAISAGIKGTGLGLAMVRHIVKAHGGSVDVRSAEGEGSTFTIVLPVKDSEYDTNIGS